MVNRACRLALLSLVVERGTTFVVPYSQLANPRAGGRCLRDGGGSERALGLRGVGCDVEEIGGVRRSSGHVRRSRNRRTGPAGRREQLRRWSVTEGQLDDTDSTSPESVGGVVDGEVVGDVVDGSLDRQYAAAVAQTTIALIVTLLFAVGLFLVQGLEPAVEFCTGYLVEESLSVDNLFVFLLIFDYFKVPLEDQNRVLSYGIFGSIVLRGVFIALGAIALEQFKPVLLVFSAILFFSSFKLILEYFSRNEEEDEDLADNAIVKFASGLIDTTDKYDGDRFFTMVDGVSKATPLLLCLFVVELTDVVFAVDSVPAVFGVTNDPFIVFTSNMFAILGLRSLYTILASAAAELEYLEPAVAIILGFVGAKLGAEFFGYQVSNEVSLGVISLLLAGGIGLSLGEKEAEAEGTLP